MSLRTLLIILVVGVVIKTQLFASPRSGPGGPMPPATYSSPSLDGVYASSEHTVSFEFRSGGKVNLWSRPPDFGNPPVHVQGYKQQFLGEVSYVEEGTSLLVVHSCGEFKFTKTDGGLYQKEDGRLFRLLSQ